MNTLKQILAYKKQEVEVRKILVPESELEKSSFIKRECHSLRSLLLEGSGTGIIAEFKRRSPSRGFINTEADVEAVTNAYTRFGASGLSVLTDNHFFGGSSEDLVTARANDIPLLRKDFMIDKYQILVSKALGADVILLIASCLTKSKVKSFAAYAKKLGMEVLLEIHDESELDHICDDVDMVGINNRDLKTFQVDINRSLELGKHIPADKVKIAESGIRDAETVKLFRAAGFKGFLMGELFMREKDPGNAFGNFVKQL